MPGTEPRSARLFLPTMTIVIEGYTMLPCHPRGKSAPLTVYIFWAGSDVTESPQ